MNKTAFFRIILLLWLIGIFCVSLSSNPKNDYPLYASFGPFALHIIAFSALFALFYFSFDFFKDNIILRLSFFLGLTIFVSSIKEFAQLFAKGRFCSLDDILIDAVSALIAAVIIGLSEWRIKCLKHQL